ncbi:MAG: serine dehydratase beta chain, partial [Saprospiraceae bacterium]
MERISIFDIFKTGVGPSSSHTMGPWMAARRFLENKIIADIGSVRVKLYGSLAKTGRGHGTDIAVMLGLAGHHPATMDVEKIDGYIRHIYDAKKLLLHGELPIPFDPLEAIGFIYEKLPFHPNALTFEALLKNGETLTETFYSIGGGFVVQEKDALKEERAIELPHPISSELELLRWVGETGLPISGVVLRNELSWRSEEEVREGLLDTWRTMLACIYRGCHITGE